MLSPIVTSTESERDCGIARSAGDEKILQGFAGQFGASAVWVREEKRQKGRK
jgi:hypothetical protein